MMFGDPNRIPSQPIDPPKGHGIDVPSMLADEGVDDLLAYAKADDLYERLRQAIVDNGGPLSTWIADAEITAVDDERGAEHG